MTKNTECESCLVAGEHTPATTYSINPEFSGYDLCAECAAEYDGRMKKSNTGRTPRVGRLGHDDKI